MIEARSNGVVIGIVSDLEDDLGLGRIKVTYPHLGNAESDWARLAVPMAGAERGTFFRPEREDEVLVAFEHGDPRRPYILGSLWSQADPPPPDDGKPKENNLRFIQSRSGHIFLLDDTPGKEKIALIDKDGKRRVVIDSGQQKIQVQCELGNVEIEAPAGDVTVKASNITLEATGIVTIKGSMVKLN